MSPKQMKTGLTLAVIALFAVIGLTTYFALRAQKRQSAAQSTPAASGQQILPAHRATINRSSGILSLTTDSGQYFNYQLPGGAHMIMDAATSVVLENDSSLKLVRGEIYLRIPHNFPYAMASPALQALNATGDFSVYASRDVQSIAVLNGSCRLRTTGQQQSGWTKLQAGRKITLTPHGKNNTPTQRFDHSLKDSLFDFEEEAFSQGMARVARWYRVTLELRGDTSILNRQHRFSGTIPRRSTIRDLVAILKINGVAIALDSVNRRLVVELPPGVSGRQRRSANP